MRRPRDDYNNGWLSIVPVMLPYLFALLFRDVYDAIDWARGVEFLDKEMEYAISLGGKGKRALDKLIKVWLKDGTQEWILLHLEFQNQVDPTFPRRMFVYGSLMFIRHGVDVASFAILGDPSPSWRPESFERGRFGTTSSYRFRMVKLLDFQDRIEELQQSDNPFALVVLAHLEAIATRRNPTKRRESKEHLTVQLLDRELEHDLKVDLSRFLQLVMPLPQEMELEYEDAVRKYERSRAVPVMTQWEKRAHNEGRQQGRNEGRREEAALILFDILEARFGPVSEAHREQIDRTDTETLRRWARKALTADRVESALD